MPASPRSQSPDASKANFVFAALRPTVAAMAPKLPDQTVLMDSKDQREMRSSIITQQHTKRSKTPSIFDKIQPHQKKKQIKGLYSVARPNMTLPSPRKSGRNERSHQPKYVTVRNANVSVFKKRSSIFAT